MNPQNYFVECNIKTCKNKYSNTKWDCDFTDFTIPEGSQITLSSAYINSVGAGDLISINQSGDEQNNTTRLVFNFYGNNDALNMKREGYQFSSDNRVYQDVDNKPMLLYRWSINGALLDPSSIYPFATNLCKEIEDSYVPGIYHGDFVIPPIQLQVPGNGINRQLTMDIDIGTLPGKYQPTVQRAIRFKIGTSPQNVYLYNALVEGTYIYLQCIIAFQGSTFAMNGMFFITEINADNFLIQLPSSQINNIGFTQFNGNITSFSNVVVNYLYGIPACMITNSSNPNFNNTPYIFPTIDRTSINSFLPPAGTQLYNYKLEEINYTQNQGSLEGYLQNSTNTLLEKHVDISRKNTWYFTGVNQTPYTTNNNSNIEIYISDNAQYIAAKTAIEQYPITQLVFGQPGKQTYSYYVSAGSIDGAQIIIFNPLLESMGIDDQFTQTQQTTYQPNTPIGMISLYHYMETYIGIHVNTSGGFLSSPADVNQIGGRTISFCFGLTPSEDSNTVNMTTNINFAKKIYISSTTRPANDFVIHYRYKDILITDLSYVSPSDLATEVTKQLHTLTDAYDNTGTLVPNSKNQSIPQNEFIFPIWFPWNVQIDTNHNIMNIDVTPNPSNSDILEFDEPTDINNYWIMNDGSYIYGMLNRTVATNNYGVAYFDLTKTYIPEGAFIWIHETFNIPNVANNKYAFYPSTRHLAINYGDMTNGTNGLSDFPVVYEEPYDIDKSTLTSYDDIIDAQTIIGYPIRYIPNQNTFISQMIGSNNPTLSYDESISKFSLELLHQPYTSPYDVQTATGGDNSIIIYFPACVNTTTNTIYKSNLSRLGGVNIMNYCAHIKPFGISQNSTDYENPFTSQSKIGIAFWQMLGFNINFLNQNSGFSYDSNNQLILNGTTDALIDSSDGLITSSDNGINFPRYIEANIYQNTTSPTPSAEQAKYRFSSLTGQNLNNASLGYSNGPNTAGSGNVVDFVKFTENIQVKNANGTEVTVHSTGDINLLASICNPDRQRQRFYVVKVDSTAIMANGLPQKEKEPFYYVLSNIVDDGSYITSTPTKAPIVGIVSKLNSALDYFYSYVSPLTFTMQKTRIVSSISIEITTSKLGPPLLVNDSSIMIFQITIPPMSIPPDPPSIEQIQEEEQLTLDNLIMKEPKTGEALQQIMLTDMFPMPSTFPAYDQYLRTTNDNPPMSKAKYAQNIRLRKKYADMKAIADKISLISSIIDERPENIPVSIFDSIVTKANEFNISL